MKGIDGVITVDADEDDAATTGINEMVVCDNTYEDEDVSSKADRPGGDDGCFRLIGPGAMGRDAAKGPDYLAGWSIELSPEGADVTWGNVDWEEDPFEDLDLRGHGSHHGGRPRGHLRHVRHRGRHGHRQGLEARRWCSARTTRSIMWSAGATASTGHERMFKTLWFDDNLNGKIKKDATSAAQADRVTALAASGVTDAPPTNGSARPLQPERAGHQQHHQDLAACSPTR